MPVSLEEIKSVKNLDQLKKLVAKPIIRRNKFISMHHQELAFLGRFLAIVGLECAYALQKEDVNNDFSRAIKFCEAIRNWYASGRYDNSIYHREALSVLADSWYLNEDASNDLKLYEFSGIQYNRDPKIYFDSAFSAMERLKLNKIDILPQLKIALIYEGMDVYMCKFHNKIPDSY